MNICTRIISTPSILSGPKSDVTPLKILVLESHGINFEVMITPFDPFFDVDLDTAFCVETMHVSANIRPKIRITVRLIFQLKGCHFLGCDKGGEWAQDER